MKNKLNALMQGLMNKNNKKKDEINKQRKAVKEAFFTEIHQIESDTITLGEFIKNQQKSITDKDEHCVCSININSTLSIDIVVAYKNLGLTHDSINDCVKNNIDIVRVLNSKITKIYTIPNSNVLYELHLNIDYED